MEGEIGPKSSSVGISVRGVDIHVKRSTVPITNYVINELKEYQKRFNLSDSKLYSWVIEILSKRGLHTNAGEYTVHKKIKRVMEKVHRLRKHVKLGELEDFLSQPFELPLAKPPKSTVAELPGELPCELEQISDIEIIQDKLKTKQTECRVLKQNLKRKLDKIEGHTKTIDTQKNENLLLKRSVKKHKEDPVTKRLEKVSHQKSSLQYYHKSQKQKQKEEHEKSFVEVETECDNLKEKLKQANEMITELQIENDRLKLDLAEEKEMNSKIRTKSDGKTFTPAIHETVFFLRKRGVSSENVGPVIQHCVTKLAKKEVVGDLPSSTSVNRMVREMGELSKMQVAEELMQEKDLTLKYDGTTVRKSHLGEIQLASKSKTYTLSISEMPSGTSDAYLDAINQSIDDVQSSSNIPNVKQHLLTNIANTMTDRHIVNKATNTKLQDQIQKENKDHVINQFFCAMHPIETFAKTADKNISIWEKEANLAPPQSFGNRGCSNTQAIIQAALRLKEKDGAGLPSEVETYLKSKNIPRNICVPFLGSRFNILFFNAAGVYYLAPHFVTLLGNIIGPSNPLHTALLKDLQVPHYLAAIRALGLVDKVISGPWMRLADAPHNILEMNSHYAHFVQQLEKWIHDPSPILNGTSGTIFPYQDTNLHDDEIYKKLIEPTDQDKITTDLLIRILQGICDDAKRQLEDQLPGGIHSEPTSELKEKSESCQCNNISGERVFAKWKQIKVRAPNSKNYNTALVQWGDNDTGQWFEDKGEEEKERALRVARKLAREHAIRDKEREEKIMQIKLQKLRERQDELAKKADNVRQNRENLIADLFEYGGLWKTKNQMEIELGKLTSTKDKLKAIKTQLNTRKKILGQEGDFSFSTGKKPLSVEDLKGKLLALFATGTDTDHDGSNNELARVITDPKCLIGKLISHLWTENAKDVWYKGIVSEWKQDSEELSVKYMYETGESDPVYLTVDEVVTDMKNGDLVVLWND